MKKDERERKGRAKRGGGKRKKKVQNRPSCRNSPWILHYFGGDMGHCLLPREKAMEEKCSQAYSQAQSASLSFENERTSAAKSSQAYSDLQKALATQTDSSPALCSAGTHEAIEANEALTKTLGSKQENLSYLSVSLLSQENVSNLQEEKSLAQEAIKSANSSLPSLSSSSKAEAESRISDLQNELNSQTPSLSGIKDAMLALDGSLKLSQNTK